MKNDFSTNKGVEKALEEAMDIYKLSDDELYNVRALVISAYYAGRDSGIMNMSEAWKKSIEKTFAKETSYDHAA
jgi:hypothetical protein